MRFASMQKCACMDMPMSRMAAGTSHELAAAVEVMKALASTARLAIVLELASGPLRVHELVRATGMPQPRVSQELRVLRGAGIVRGARTGREIAYTLTDHHLAHIARDALNHGNATPLT